MIMRDPNPYKLLTPGPLTTTLSVREAMMIDRCTWDDDYKRMTEEIRAGLLDFAHAGDDYTVVLMQGSGTFGVESVLSSVPGAKDCVLVLVNGAYSERMVKILDRHGIAHARLDFAWDEIPDAARVEAFLAEHPEVTVVSMVHNETTTGILNDIEAVGRVVKAAGRTFVVDAMSSFGAVDIRVADIGIDYLVSSANKCIQGVPGFSYIIARREALEATEGNARTVSLDLYDQWKGLEEGHGKWRFTSPTHVVAALRYARLNRRLREGMAALGFTAYVEEAHQGPIITTFFYPKEGFSFPKMYAYLKEHGYVIYPGKLTDRDTFRLGNIGDLNDEDAERILKIFADFCALEEQNGAH